jgi:hypothetical protein
LVIERILTLLQISSAGMPTRYLIIASAAVGFLILAAGVIWFLRFYL